MKLKKILFIVSLPFILVAVIVIIAFSSLIYLAYFHHDKPNFELMNARNKNISVRFIWNANQQLSYQAILDTLDKQLPERINTDHNVHINGMASVHVLNRMPRKSWENQGKDKCK